MLMKNPKKLVDCSIVTLTAFFGCADPVLRLRLGHPDVSDPLCPFPAALPDLRHPVRKGKRSAPALPDSGRFFFLPTIFLFYDSSVWPFWVTYIMIAFIGVAIGYFIQCRNSNTNSKGRLR